MDWKNPKEVLKYKKEYKKENPDKVSLHNKTYKLKHKEETKKYRKEDKQRKKLFIRATKSKGCVICGEKDYRCLDFHHRKREEKECNVSQIRTRGIGAIVKEIEKCDILCANCHRKTTFPLSS